MDLSPDNLQYIIDKLDDSTESNKGNIISKTLQIFPFNNLVNISLRDVNITDVCLRILTHICEDDLIYNDTSSVKCTLNFILWNLSTVTNNCPENVVANLIGVLKLLIFRLISDSLSAKLLEKERILEVLALSASSKSCGERSIKKSIVIVKCILTANGRLSPSISPSLEELVKCFTDSECDYELSSLCSIIFNKFPISNSAFKVAAMWLLMHGPNLLKKAEDSDQILDLVKAMNDLFSKLGYINKLKKYEKTEVKEKYIFFHCNLMEMSANICRLTSKLSVRKECIKLLGNIIYEFSCTPEMLVLQTHKIICQELEKLPLDIQKWPNTTNIYFFYVCHMLYLRSRLLWSSEEILTSMSQLVYSYSRCFINVSLLKTLCFLYPVLIADCMNKSTILLGDNLLLILKNYKMSHIQIYSYHISQLTWVINRGYMPLKIDLLARWLLRDEDKHIVMKLLKRRKAGKVLLNILSGDFDDNIKTRAVEMIQQVEDSNLFKHIAFSLPTMKSNMKLFNKLILCNPGVPEDVEDAQELCIFMVTILPEITEVAALEAAVVYTKNLLVCIKKEDAVRNICQHFDYSHCLEAMKAVPDEAAVGILKLLKTLLAIQRKNKLCYENPLDWDPSALLEGSFMKVKQGVDLLLVIIVSENLIIRINEPYVMEVYSKLLDLSTQFDVAFWVYICLIKLIRRHPWLAFTQLTNIYIEMQCSSLQDEACIRAFIDFLNVWMKTVLSSQLLKTSVIPKEAVMRHFIERNKEVSLIKTTNCIKLLKKIKNI